jgi:hypothetical protein
MTTITIILTDQTSKEYDLEFDSISGKDYETIVFWAENVVEHNDNIDQIIVCFNKFRMIFETIN